jgi:uncharacterized protein (TIGR00255 family)
MTLTSMTGFADLAGAAGGAAWVWEARSVNGRGFDLRLRLPDGLESLEPPLRAAAGQALSRGSVTVTLRFAKAGAAALPRLNPDALAAAVAASRAAAEAAAGGGLDLAPISAADLLAMPGVFDTAALAPAEDPEVRAALAAEIEPLIAALARARAAEGAALATVLAGQLDRAAALAAQARETAEARAGRAGALLRTRLDAVLAATAAVDEARLAQELALVAVRADVTEELDRLAAHLTAARRLLATPGPVGRKLDFLMQEFNREANTLCSKAGSAELTGTGLELKAVIDQMREQVQNVE